ncbi:hypothetical protein CUPS3785_07325 [Campylobacter upsaliensis]|uniref:Uncharacterized protein n=1 Tax=Campylobacter helveticus TaxID=28898 RepID=A0AAX2UHW0_9BACT|nr:MULTISPECIES: hypothetical protein [Campylobacter]EDH3310016.1 hypothetical protein [Campylobacter jejuni]EAI2893740.1 hypothetical protein [Campylobacter upsaliensis]EAI9945298.1 hypothetical protein [Campylobacter upsaliensis]EAJ1462302.1 hypothetical protein [Campylobacter upsaliensis]EAJ4646488.1 hypothetical protein [Campylobacter upsaliensis]
MTVYDDNAALWLEYALEDMKRRNDWEFPQEIKFFLYETIETRGFTIKDDPNETLWFLDDFYINGNWGHIDEMEWSKEEALRLYEEGNLSFYDEASGYYVESL